MGRARGKDHILTIIEFSLAGSRENGDSQMNMIYDTANGMDCAIPFFDFGGDDTLGSDLCTGVKIAYPGHGLFESRCAHGSQRLAQMNLSIL